MPVIGGNIQSCHLERSEGFPFGEKMVDEMIALTDNQEKKRFQFGPRHFIALIVVVISALLYPHLSKASTIGSNIQGGALEGIDTLIVATQISPMQGLLNHHMQANTAIEWDGAIVEKLENFFHDDYKIKVTTYRNFKSKSLEAENIIVLNFTISARKETLNDSDLTVVSLFPKLLKYKKGGIWTEIYTNGIAYPFIAPKDHSAFLKKIQSGAYFVTLSMFCSGMLKEQSTCHQFKEND